MTDAERLRQQMTDQLLSDQAITTTEVEAAFRAVPRHVFAPEAPLEHAYALDRVITKKDRHGVTISSVSAPQIQALMMEQAGLKPGMRVLEIGSGGYNAALVAEIVGTDGQVTTIDIDAEVIDRARTCLRQAGYQQVEATTTDGEFGHAGRAPFDAIIVTVGAWDIPPAWSEQLAPDGSITVPLRMRGLTRSISFVRSPQGLVSRSANVCGFVTMQGEGEHQERTLLLRGQELALRFDDDGFPTDPSVLDGVLAAGQAHVWPDVTIAPTQSFETLQLWLATSLPGFCLLTAHKDLDSGLVKPLNRISTPALVRGAGFAYLTSRRLSADTVQFGVHAFGTEAAAVAEILAEQVRVWDREHRGGPGPQFTIVPAGSGADVRPHGQVITKRHSHLIVSWPSAATQAVGQDVMHQFPTV